MEEPQRFEESVDPLQDEKDEAILAREIAPADIPIANVLRIMKSALPENAKIAKEAKECVQECISEFISFITSEASEKCSQEKRKTVNGEDILFAMTSLGFENYSEALKIYLTKYRENAKMLEERQESGNSAKRAKKRKTDEPEGDAVDEKPNGTSEGGEEYAGGYPEY
ncbi:protein of unknown function [Taphrina deformans PYCC 5710]|uniref:Transcription factor CBF/NF-Y/archaeal histone domain-containing protein n=1 Tax=Taphrina deformans (strain PYCC 5710 / ATCC 11124 / CBS 356.35 / IMI 108563 / JCM 9778 / NBRC 8474) TaxID=1097556 RepID=R4XD59_TAPDE|nr:protein of unknown function [Taphrina deformans PYCC 5710]|eukprot:CCG83816.1 protein of unknown function [Taphrina deformans PYCC 5710]